MKNTEMVMYDSPEAASIQTLTGWVDRHGRFWGKDEHMARFAGSTHQLCDKNPEHGIRANNSYCEACHDERAQARFMAMERQPWDCETMLAILLSGTGRSPRLLPGKQRDSGRVTAGGVQTHLPARN